MSVHKIEPSEVLEARRDAALAGLAGAAPYSGHMGFAFFRQGDEITGHLPYARRLIGNPVIPALHGGVTAAFIEIVAATELVWRDVWEAVAVPGPAADAIAAGRFPALPRTLDFTVHYFRAGQPRDSHARARVNRRGRRFASVEVDVWQDSRDRPIARGFGHFMLAG